VISPPIDRAIGRALVWTVGGSALAIPLLLVPDTTHYLSLSTYHLIAVVILELTLALNLAPIVDEDGWFVTVRPSLRPYASAAAVIALVTGMAALVTLATSAALGMKPSLQFLQLLSAIDIAWVATAAVIGGYRLAGRWAAVGGGVFIGVYCVWAIWNYLHTVGFGPNGEWLVQGDDLFRLVIVNDMIAAVIGLSLLFLGTLKLQRTEQPSPQS
jgi:hypothetical protein